MNAPRSGCPINLTLEALVYGPADERDGREPDGAGAAAAERTPAVGADLPVLMAAAPGAGRSTAGG